MSKFVKENIKLVVLCAVTLVMTIVALIGHEFLKADAKRIRIDVFEKISIGFDGYGPYAKLTLVNNWEDEYLKDLTFSADKLDGIKAGDKIKVTCESTKKAVKEHGYKIEFFEKEYDTEGLLSLVESAKEQLNKETLRVVADETEKNLVAATADSTYRMSYNATKDSKYLRMENDETLENVKMIDVHFLNTKAVPELLSGHSQIINQAANENKNISKIPVYNYLYVTCSADIRIGDEVIPVYFVYEYTNAYMMLDGKVGINKGVSKNIYEVGTQAEVLQKIYMDDKSSNYEITEVKF